MKMDFDKAHARPHPYPLPQGEGETLAASRKFATHLSFVRPYSKRPKTAPAPKPSKQTESLNRCPLSLWERVRVRASVITSLIIISLAFQLSTVASAQPQTAPTPAPGQIPPLPPSLPKEIPAFPGAWGGGMFTVGGRGGQVIAVTNLNDSGPGSLRAAIDADGPRIVAFRVAGTILLQRNLDINNPNITIAGQSAPGDGICLANHSVNINTREVVLRHLRVRRGMPGGQGSDNIGGNPEGQVIVDHCSVSWGRDENISLYRYMKGSEKNPTRNVTIQWVISSEALGPGHEFGGTWGGQDSTFHHNLFACNTGRNPSIGMSGEFDYRNNVLFNWGHRSMDGGDETSLVNVINNYYKAGPATRENMATVMARMESRNQYSPGRDHAGSRWYPETRPRPGKWYVAGNIMENDPTVTADNWKGMGGNAALGRVNTPFEGWPVYQQPAQEAYEAVLAKAGATLPRRDVVDQRVVEMVRTGKPAYKDGIITNPDQVGGYPALNFAVDQVPTDTDGDGMPDEWERKHELNPTDPKDAALDTDKDGYTNVEEFLNGTVPNKFIDYRNLDNNVDTISG
jgi:pectate lyase